MIGNDDIINTRGIWDMEATICLCTHAWAQRAGLTGIPTSIFLKVVHHAHKQVTSLAYFFEVSTRQGSRYGIKAFGVEQISKERPYEPEDAVMDDFPGVQAAEVSRMGGEVDLLLGMDVVGIHPVEVKTVGHRRLLRSKFGTGVQGSNLPPPPGEVLA